MRFAITALLFAALGFGQTTPPPLATWIGAGVAVNQLGTSQGNFWLTAVYPLKSSAGIYTSSTADAFPVKLLDPTTAREFIGISTAFRQGVHKVVFQGPKLGMLLGGDAGVGISQGLPGLSYGFTSSFTATFTYKIRESFAIVVPVRCIYLPGDTMKSVWNVVPQIGVLFRP